MSEGETGEMGKNRGEGEAGEMEKERGDSRETTGMGRGYTIGMGGNWKDGGKRRQNGNRELIMLGVINKIDLMEEDDFHYRWEMLTREFPNMELVTISAKEGTGLDELREKIFSLHEAFIGTETVHLEVPEGDGAAAFINWIFRNTIVKKQESRDGVRTMELEVPSWCAKEFGERCKKVDAVWEN